MHQKLNAQFFVYNYSADCDIVIHIHWDDLVMSMGIDGN
jgi:hypothetical protein